MGRRRLEVADVVRAHRDRFLAMRGGRLASAERRVLDDIAACRTAARGGHVERCDQCAHERIAYNSCRNRHCPKCQESDRIDWLVERERDLLPVPYFHVVFTIPHELVPLARQNRKILYDLLFHASARALRTLASDPNHLGAEIGVLSVLHTWGQQLDLHPHIHCVIPGGGLAPDGERWVPCQPRFFLPVHALSRVFRGKFLSELRHAYDDGRLRLLGSLASLQHSTAFRRLMRTLYKKEWVVYAKPPFGGPEIVLRYLARYVHRVAISNRRLLALRDGRVTFRCKDYRRQGRRKTVTLDAVEFLRRFLQHLLPDGFTRIRYYGFLASRCRRVKIERCRQLLATALPDSQPAASPEPPPAPRCPHCARGRMVCVLVLRPGDPRLAGIRPKAVDSS